MKKTTYKVTVHMSDERSATELAAALIEDDTVIETSLQRVVTDYIPEAKPAVTGLDILQLLDVLMPTEVSEQAKSLAEALGGTVIATGLNLGQALNIYRERQGQARHGEDPNA